MTDGSKRKLSLRESADQPDEPAEGSKYVEIDILNVSRATVVRDRCRDPGRERLTWPRRATQQPNECAVHGMNASYGLVGWMACLPVPNRST